MYGYGNSMFLATHGILARTASGGGVDPDAQAFITAASITDPTQQSAINTLVVDLKGYGVWTKMKAIYPFVGGTATTHKFNLKNPLDTNAAFRLVFNGGWTHSANGATPNGTNAYADTNFIPSSNLTTSSAHFSKYNRTNDLTPTKIDGVIDSLPSETFFQLNYTGANGLIGEIGGIVTYTQTDTRGLFTVARTAINSSKVFKNSTQQGSTNTTTISTLPDFNVYIGARNAGVGQFFNTYQCAFASLGDGLTDTEVANYYTAVQAFQTTLGRSIGTQTVSDADAQAFVTNAGIVDQVESNAINNLVIGLKADSLWTKMKAVYPFVGGTATTNKFNLKNPLDTDAAFRLVFSGGWTHSNNGILPNGTNTFADTKLLASTQLGLNSTHVAVYSRTNTDILAFSIANATGAVNNETSLWLRATNLSYLRVNTPTASTQSTTDSRGTFIGNRNSSTQQQLMVRGTRYDYSVNSNSLNSTTNYSLGGLNGNVFWDTKQYAFASIGDGLTNTEMTNLTTRIDNFQLALNRNV